ncbi:MAG: cadherin-like domain-containing protein [Methylobacter sp.]
MTIIRNTAVAAHLSDGMEDTTYTIVTTDLLSGLSTDSGSLNVTALSSTHGSVVFDTESGNWKFIPDHNYWGNVVISYQVTDGSGAVLSTRQSFVLTAVNDAPELTGTVATLVSGTQGIPYIINAADLLQGFTDVDRDALGVGDTLSIAGLTASNGAIALNADGVSWTFTPNSNYNGPVSLNYNVIDGHGGSVSGSNSFNLAATNDIPILTGTLANLVSGTEDTSYSIKAVDLLQGFTDTSGHSLSVTGLAANHGSIAANADGASWTFTPDANYNGSVVLNYNVTDGQGGSVTGSNSFNLTAVNDLPTGVVTISGTATQGKILTASNSLADVDGLGTIGYQWQAGGVNINGATGSTYTLTQADVGKVISVVASYLDGGGTNEKVASAPTTAVTALATNGDGCKDDHDEEDDDHDHNNHQNHSGDDNDHCDNEDNDHNQNNHQNHSGADNNDCDNDNHHSSNQNYSNNNKGNNSHYANLKLSGTNKADNLKGGNGDDILYGGKGNDVLTGGNGKDVFVFAKQSGTDQITDFSVANDKILLVGNYKWGNVAQSYTHGVDTVKVGSGSDAITITLTGVTGKLSQDSFSFTKDMPDYFS